jgi:hypothetical protein
MIPTVDGEEDQSRIDSVFNYPSYFPSPYRLESAFSEISEGQRGYVAGAHLLELEVNEVIIESPIGIENIKVVPEEIEESALKNRFVHRRGGAMSRKERT